MRRLIVEDDEERRMWFARHDAEASMTADVKEAIVLLQSERYDVLYLDHDLGTEPYVGRDVAVWLAEHRECQPWLMIIVHSVNSVSAPKILQDLKHGERYGAWIPFPTLRAYGWFV